MFQSDDKDVRELLFAGRFGLEKESLRVDREGHFVRTPHPFPGNAHIVRDFCENQTEINSPVADAALDLLRAMKEFYRGFGGRIESVLVFEERKLLHPETRYAAVVRERFSGGFVTKGLELAAARQREAVNDV